MSKLPATKTRTPWWDALASKPMMLWALVLGLLAARLVWQWFSPYTLIEDEAHYWEWARRLDWSYYSKGPGVAWVIWASTRVFGDTEFAVRLPAAVSTALGMLAVAKTTLMLTDDRRYAFIAAILYNAVPGIAVAAMLMTIDAPYIACWAWASHFAISALMRGRHRDWLWFGAFIAIGFLFKYTILLLIPSVLFAMWLARRERTPVRLGWFAIGLLVSLLGLIPVVIWNAQHDWATVRHLLGHLGMRGGDTENTAGGHEPWTMMWLLEYIGLQLLVGGPVIALALFAWLNARKPGNEAVRAMVRVCIAIALPLLVFYLLVSLKTQTEGNWAMAAFVTLIPPSAWCIYDGVRRVDHPIKFFWGVAMVVFVGALVLFPAAHRMANAPLIGPLIPMYRMTGMRTHAHDAQRVLDEIEQRTGQQPFVITNHYGRASLLAFYLPGHPVVYCSSAHIGGRRTQYDEWAQTDLDNPSTLAGLLERPALMLGGPARHWESAFGTIKDIGKLEAEPKSHGTAYIGTGFKGFEE